MSSVGVWTSASPVPRGRVGHPENHGRHIPTRLGSRHEGGGGARARPEVADGQAVERTKERTPAGPTRDRRSTAARDESAEGAPGRAPSRAPEGGRAPRHRRNMSPSSQHSPSRSRRPPSGWPSRRETTAPTGLRRPDRQRRPRRHRRRLRQASDDTVAAIEEQYIP
jgi:hypothetical protein